MPSPVAFLQLSLVLICAICTSPLRAATFAGMRLEPGVTVTAQVPLNAAERSYLAEGGNAVPPYALAVLAVPPGFTPSKSWPVLISISTSDAQRQNRTDLVDFYRESALAEGWLVLAGDGPGQPQHDSGGWRAGTTLAALDALHRSFPGSEKWPVAVAGFSGGSKRAGTIAPLLALAGCRLAGIFLTGINEDRLSDGYRQFHPGAAFLRTPIFLSSGRADQVATISAQQSVFASMQRTGFTRLRHEMFDQGHAVKRTQLRAALRWFRELKG
ncbi:MAG: hypothetical protein ACR2ID_00280 [Chthoniobacterales bacterium]